MTYKSHQYQGRLSSTHIPQSHCHQLFQLPYHRSSICAGGSPWQTHSGIGLGERRSVGPFCLKVLVPRSVNVDMTRSQGGSGYNKHRANTSKGPLLGLSDSKYKCRIGPEQNNRHQSRAPTFRYLEIHLACNRCVLLNTCQFGPIRRALPLDLRLQYTLYLRQILIDWIGTNKLLP